MAKIDLKELLNEVIDTYGKNEGYVIPDISWSEENMMSRFGEYQFCYNRIIISNMMNTDKISINAIKSAIFHEYTHQLYSEHNDKFNERMRLFKGYERYNEELDSYFDSIEDIPDARKTDITIDGEDELIICRFPYLADYEDSYWKHLLYYNHYLLGFILYNIPEQYCKKSIRQVIWAVESEDNFYAVGWAKNVQLYPSVVQKNTRGIGKNSITYQFKYKQNEGKVLLPCNVIGILSDEEAPDSLKKQGICRASELGNDIAMEIVDVINSYNGDYVEVGMIDKALDEIAPVETEDVSELIRMSYKADSRDRRFLIMNKAVSMEKSYRTYLHRGLAFFDSWIFDKALENFTNALRFENVSNEKIGKDEIQKYIAKATKAMNMLEDDDKVVG